MSEWVSVLAVFWVLWAIDGIRLLPAEQFGLHGRRWRARFSYARWLLPGWWPTAWRATVADIPFALSPAGICNRPAGSAGRPAETPWQAQAWAWSEIRTVEAKDGWLLVNGGRFCRDTGHLWAGQLLKLAQLDTPARAQRIDLWLQRWLRPAHLRRRVKVLRRRTATAAMLNALFLGLAAVITVYLAGNFSERLPARWSEAVAKLLPLLAGYLALLHVMALGFMWGAGRRLKAVNVDKRASALFSAALLPPQALRLRALVGEAFLPPQHPLAYAVAFARPRELAELAFHTLGDLRWPMGGQDDPPLAQEISAWFRVELAQRLRPLLHAAGVNEAALFAAPIADGSGGCAYCPRCRSQFVHPAALCPHGVALQTVAKR